MSCNGRQIRVRAGSGLGLGRVRVGVGLGLAWLAHGSERIGSGSREVGCTEAPAGGSAPLLGALAFFGCFGAFVNFGGFSGRLAAAGC